MTPQKQEQMSFEAAWKSVLRSSEGECTMYSMFQWDQKVAVSAKTSLAYHPKPDAAGTVALCAKGFKPGKNCKWVTGWGLNSSNVFSPVGGLFLVATKCLTCPCELV